jgi:hypothetical protein
MNQFGVGAVGKKVHISNLAHRPTLTAREALELGAWLVATAAPLMPGNASAVLGQFHKMVADAGEGSDLEEAALSAARELGE